MKIGVLKRFGLKKRDGSGVPFGFLAEADEAAGEIYFNEKGIAPTSNFQEAHRRDSLVVYEVRRFRDGRSEAFNVRLLEELDRKEQLLLYRECCGEGRDAERELLCKYWRRPKRADQRVQTGVITKFGLPDRHGSLFGFLASAKGGSEFRFDSICLSQGLRRLYRNEQALRSRRSRKLFLENRFVIYQERWTNNRWSVVHVQLPEELSEDKLLALYQEWRDRDQGRELEWLFDHTQMSLEQESDEDLIFLILMMRAGEHRVSKILEQRPELLLRSPEVCGCIDHWDIADLSLELVTTDEQAAFLAQYVAKENAWNRIVHKLPDSLVLGCPRALAAVPSDRAISLLPLVDSTSDSEEEQARFYTLLTRVDWGRLKEADIDMLRPLLEQKPDAYIASLIVQLRGEKPSLVEQFRGVRQSVAALIGCRPALLWTDPEVCACVEWNDIGELPLDQLIPADETVCRHTLLAKFDFRYHVPRYINTVRPMWEREPDEYIISLLTKMKAEGRSIALPLQWKPELLLTSPEVCACVEEDDIKNIQSLTALIQTDEQAAFLAEHAGDSAWSRIAPQLPDPILLRCPRALDAISEIRMCALLSRIDWASAGEEDLERGRALLAKIRWDWPEDVQIDAVRPLLERETEEDLVSLVTKTRAAGRGVSVLLAWRPELLWTHPEVCACVCQADIISLPLGQLVQTDEQAAFLAEHAKEDTWDAIAPKLSGKVLLHCKRAMDGITKGQLRALLTGADWTDTSEGNLEDYRPLLAKLHWDTALEEVVAATVSLREQGLELCWWQRMTDSMKIRLLMYLSDLAGNERTERRWFEKLEKIRQWEAGEDDHLVCAVLQFFAGIYIEAGTPYQNNFLQAHRMLMGYITDCFTQRIDVTPGLSALLEHCRSNSDSGKYFCDGRCWRNQNCVYCPGLGRSCPYYEDMDLTKTKFRAARQQGRAVDHKDLSFMDFLLNIGGIPDLDRYDVGISVKEEYPFRISAYVNSLIRLRPHMKCSHCGELFHPEFQYAKLITARLPITVFHCSNSDQEGEHDQDVYLNFCYRCHEIIDSRECCQREKLSDSGAFEGVISVEETLTGSGSQYGQYLCMHCGGSRNIDPRVAVVCPKCGCADSELVERTRKGGVVCKECGYHSSEFCSKFEEEEELS